MPPPAPMPLDYARIPTEARRWIIQRPPAVRAVIERYPPGVYDVRAGAPYALTGPGTRVVLVAYVEEDDGGAGQVTVRVLRPTAAADATARERSGGRVATAAATTAVVDPRWLELVEVSPILKPAWTPPDPSAPLTDGVP